MTASETARSRQLRLVSSTVALSVIVFAALEVSAMLLYPGGTWWDRTTHGASFWQNYLCDLGADVALDGVPNPVGSRFSQAAMLVLAFGLCLFWWIVPSLFAPAARGPLGRVVRALGVMSFCGTVAVVVLPSSRVGPLHGATVVVAGLPGLSAAVVTVVALLRGEPRPRVAGALGASMFGFALASFLLYVRTLVLGGPGPVVIPVAQKAALLLLMAWLLAVALRAPRLGSGDATETRRPP
jgi:hypothetical protein